ncbi:MAG: NBR1-Ig-like domain-containing protein [Betaproteobacteria bacterium]
MRWIARSISIAGAIVALASWSAALAQDNAQFVAQTFNGQAIPPNIEAGAQVSATITMRNTGRSAWSTTPRVAYRLGSQSAPDDRIWGLNRVDLPASVTVSPQGQVTFAFTITAPNTPGDYAFQWKMLWEQPATWFGEASPATTIHVVAPGPAVTLLHAGKDHSPLSNMCDPALPMRMSGMPLGVQFEGRSNTASDAAGTLRIASPSPIHWTAGGDPQVTFHPASGGSTVIGTFPVTIDPGTALGWQQLHFAAVDARQTASGMADCFVRIIPRDVEVAALTIDTPFDTPPQVNFRLLNHGMLAVDVPWTIAVTHLVPARMNIIVPVTSVSSPAPVHLVPGTPVDIAVPLPIPPPFTTLLLDLRVEVDPLNTGMESAAERTNNVRLASFAIPVRTPPPLVLVSQALDYRMAEANGAHFDYVVAPFCQHIGPGDWHDYRWAPSDGRKDGVLFRVQCLKPMDFTAEVYRDFRLKNGWRIKSVDDVVFVRDTRRKDLTIVTPAAVGSDNPHMKVSIAAGAFSNVAVGIRVFIEGPAGTDPYVEGNACPSGCSLLKSVCLRTGGGGAAYACSTHSDCADSFGCNPGNGKCEAVCSP